MEPLRALKFINRDVSFFYTEINSSKNFKIPYFLAAYIFLFTKSESLSDIVILKHSIYLFDNNKIWLGREVRGNKLIYELLTQPIKFEDNYIYAYHSYVFNNCLDGANQSLGMMRFIAELYTTNFQQTPFALSSYEIYSSKSKFFKNDNFTVTNILEYVIKSHFSIEYISEAKNSSLNLLFLIACIIFNYDIFKYSLTKRQSKDLESNFYIDNSGQRINISFASFLANLYNNFYRNYDYNLIKMLNIKPLPIFLDDYNFHLLKEHKILRIA